ncbi:MAG: fluoride efflux transporter CrcB [Yonghaparkia sp.]|nr:fluoride efflux transporter CrcB [Microcella sp.]
MTPLLVLAVAVGGALGAVLRHLASVSVAGRGRIPWGVLVVNVAGSFIAGLALGLPLDPTAKLIVLTGFCGGLTTFSTLSVDTVQLILDGKRRAAAVSVLLNLALGIPAVLLGLLLGLFLGHAAVGSVL